MCVQNTVSNKTFYSKPSIPTIDLVLWYEVLDTHTVFDKTSNGFNGTSSTYIYSNDSIMLPYNATLASALTSAGCFSLFYYPNSIPKKVLKKDIENNLKDRIFFNNSTFKNLLIYSTEQTGGSLDKIKSFLSNTSFFENTTNVSFRFKSDEINEGHISGSNITIWDDTSGNNNNATSDATYPTLVQNGFGSFPIVRLNGGVMTFNEAAIKSLIWIGKESASSESLAPLIGNTVEWAYARSSQYPITGKKAIFDTATENAKASVKMNGKRKSPIADVLPLTTSIISTSTSYSCNVLNIARDRIASRDFLGDILLIKGFSTELSNDDMMKEIRYWSNHYNIEVINDSKEFNQYLGGHSMSVSFPLLVESGKTLTTNSNNGWMPNVPVKSSILNGWGGSYTLTGAHNVLLEIQNQPTLKKENILIWTGCNDVGLKYMLSESVQRAYYYDMFVQVYDAAKSKFNFDQIVFINCPATRVNPVTTDGVAILSGPFFYLLNEELSSFAATKNDVVLIDAASIIDPNDTTNYLTDGFHISLTGKDKLCLDIATKLSERYA